MKWRYTQETVTAIRRPLYLNNAFRLRQYNLWRKLDFPCSTLESLFFYVAAEADQCPSLRLTGLSVGSRGKWNEKKKLQGLMGIMWLNRIGGMIENAIICATGGWFCRQFLTTQSIIVGKKSLDIDLSTGWLSFKRIKLNVGTFLKLTAGGQLPSHYRRPAN